jgi:hypothetical protein
MELIAGEVVKIMLEASMNSEGSSQKHSLAVSSLQIFEQLRTSSVKEEKVKAESSSSSSSSSSDNKNAKKQVC